MVDGGHPGVVVVDDGDVGLLADFDGADLCFEADGARARAQVEAASGDLASRVLAAVLPATSTAQEAAK